MSWQRAPRATWPSPWQSGKQDLVSVLQELKNSISSNGAGSWTKLGLGISEVQSRLLKVTVRGGGGAGLTPQLSVSQRFHLPCFAQYVTP